MTESTIKALLETESLTVAFGGLVAVSDVSLSVEKGEIRGLIGPNGAGKSTFFNAISGLVKPSTGRIVFDGADVTRVAPHKRASLGIRRTFQSVQLLPELTVLENVMVGLHDRLGDGLLRSLFNPSASQPAEAAAIDRSVAVLSDLGIADTLFEEIESLTFAQQRKVEIARALVAGPGILMLDEPAAGLSASEVAELDDLLARLRDETGLTILLVEHVMALVMNVCDKVTVLDNGAVISGGTPETVANDPKVKVAYLGEDEGDA